MRLARLATAGRERGALSLMVVVLFCALILMAGIVVDGGAQLTAYENAEALAQEAARAGATSVDASSAYRSGAFVVDAQQAQAAVSAYLATAGNRDYRVSLNGVSFIGNSAIEVTVTVTEPTEFLSLIGVPTISCRRSATASLVTGVTGGT
jgi:Flp pilus assembly protein TadG